MPILAQTLTYVLDGPEVVAEPDTQAWQDWMAAASRTEGLVVAHTEISSDLKVSTAFIGIDHGPAPLTGAPQLFETLVFADGAIVQQGRYSTWTAAARGHEAVVADLIALG